ncbi:glutamate racemase [uncultured Pseudodesulfovibrio sp.]|uniref:glutamate racemase n=1 Tax=uncultured Pseudodesulfovibrio sp. TaxID=2035858 RepID=UPI0029C6AEC2|nr:glutamate racemase [uncultured Pseudodesulfovibrio sp.]
MLDVHTISLTDMQGHACNSELTPKNDSPCIGLFDSGVGGLSVLRALQHEIPWADYIYCGDTARLPYGKRKPETIVEYSMQASRFLIESGAESIVIACNTASSVALNAVQQAFPETMVRGVVEAGARAATNATRSGKIAVIGTECTVASQAYDKAITRLAPGTKVRSYACPFLVSLAEEGWTDCDIATLAARKYLEPLFAKFAPHKADCLVLGCTHFSKFANVIQDIVGPEVALIDPADCLAKELAPNFRLPAEEKSHRTGTASFHATDAPLRFARVGELFLETPIPRESLKQITLDNQ